MPAIVTIVMSNLHVLVCNTPTVCVTVQRNMSLDLIYVGLPDFEPGADTPSIWAIVLNIDEFTNL